MAVSQIDADGENTEYENTISVAPGSPEDRRLNGNSRPWMSETRTYPILPSVASAYCIVRRYKDGSSRTSGVIGALISFLA